MIFSVNIGRKQYIMKMNYRLPMRPIGRVITEGSVRFCTRCGSSMRREYLIVGKWKCTHSKCR